MHCFGYFHRKEHSASFLPSQSPQIIHVLFLQHHKEVWRKTGTALLVQQAVEDGSDISSYLRVSNFTWTGRADNESLEQLLTKWTKKGFRVILLWKGGTPNVTEFLPPEAAKAFPPLFVLIDGTWQEAQTMFRKIPALLDLPRLELQSANPSNYQLRGNFGWKERFDVEDGGSLLCTVEAVAELLEQAGRVDGGKELRKRLDTLSRELNQPKKCE